jgi:hypothetical protein
VKPYLQLRAQERRLERLSGQVEKILAHMRRDDLVLYHEYREGSSRFRLSTGEVIDKDVAQILITSAAVMPSGDALFPHLKSQTYRATMSLRKMKDLKV